MPLHLHLINPLSQNLAIFGKTKVFTRVSNRSNHFQVQPHGLTMLKNEHSLLQFGVWVLMMAQRPPTRPCPQLFQVA